MLSNALMVKVNDNNRVVVRCLDTEITFGYLDTKKVNDLERIWDIFEDVHEVNAEAVNWQIKLIYTHLDHCMKGVQIGLQNIVNDRIEPEDKKTLCKSLFRQIRKRKKD